MINDQPQKIIAQDLTIEFIHSLRTFGRSAKRSTGATVKIIINELLNEPVELIKFIPEKITKSLQYTYSFKGEKHLRILNKKLINKFHSSIYLPIWRDLNVAIGNFPIAVSVSELLCQNYPDEIIHIQRLADTYFAAGLPVKGIRVLKEHHKILFTLSKFSKANVLAKLLSANQFRWLRQNFPNEFQQMTAPTEKFINETPQKSPIKTFCISMERDRQRLINSHFFIKNDQLDFRHVVGIEGSKVDHEFYYNIFDVKDGFPTCSTGELGCAISHFKACATIAEECDDDEYGLVVEDDAHFIYGSARGLNSAINISRTQNFEMTFINQSACLSFQAFANDQPVSIISLDELFEKVLPVVNKQPPGWGGYGYLLSGNGARKLVAVWKKIGILGAIDIQLALMGVSNLSIVPARRSFRDILHKLENLRLTDIELVPINAAVINCPVISTLSNGYSSINLG